jgi:hypothetical protein
MAVPIESTRRIAQHLQIAVGKLKNALIPLRDSTDVDECTPAFRQYACDYFSALVEPLHTEADRGGYEERRGDLTSFVLDEIITDPLNPSHLSDETRAVLKGSIEWTPGSAMTFESATPSRLSDFKGLESDEPDCANSESLERTGEDALRADPACEKKASRDIQALFAPKCDWERYAPEGLKCLLPHKIIFLRQELGAVIEREAISWDGRFERLDHISGIVGGLRSEVRASATENSGEAAGPTAPSDERSQQSLPHVHALPPMPVWGVGGIPSQARVGTPDLIQQLKFVENRHTIPECARELKQLFRGLAQASIVAATRRLSVPLTQVDDWVDHLRQSGHYWETMEQLLVASKTHLVDLRNRELAAGSLDEAQRFDALEAKFGDLLSRVQQTEELSRPGTSAAPQGVPATSLQATSMQAREDGPVRRYEIGTHDQVSPAQRKIQFEQIESLAVEFIAALASGVLEPSEASQALIDYLWQNSPYFTADNRRGLSMKKTRIDNLPAALLHEVEKLTTLARAADDQKRIRRLKDIEDACRKLPQSLYAHGPITVLDSGQQPTPEERERVRAELNEERRAELAPLPDSFLMDFKGTKVPWPEMPAERTSDERTTRRRGRKADDVLNSRMARIVRGVGDKWEDRLSEVAKALDQDIGDDGNVGVELIRSTKWDQMLRKSGNRLEGEAWVIIADEDPEGLKKALRYRIKWAEEHPEG